jgi:hypothetical protein
LVKLNILLVTAIFSFTLEALAEPKVKIMVEPTMDRWIHFPDGAKLRHGMEVTHMLNQLLFNTDRFRIQVPETSGPGIQSIVELKSFGVNPEEIQERLPNSAIDYYNDKVANHRYGLGRAQIIVQPRVHTLLYASGKKSNRVVYGFSPDRLNPYNAGIDGISKENDFTAKQFDEVKKCTTLDFFGGQVATSGWGHRRSNFGADADEGFSFEIFGFGVSFKKKTYAVKMGISFDVVVPEKNFRQTFDYEFTAKGKDLSIGASYAGIHLGFETQRRFTMRNALEEGLPQLMNEFIADLPEYIWQARIKSLPEGGWMLNAGMFDGLQVGDLLEAENGNRYVVADVREDLSFVMFLLNNPYPPKDGEVLRFVGDDGKSPWQQQGPGIRGLASKASMNTLSNNSLSPVKKKLAAELNSFSQPELVEKNIGNCAERKHSWWEKLVMAIMTFYGQWRYDNVYDQSFDHLQPKTFNKQNVARVALVSSGVFPREPGVADHVDPTGYDFISWDPRPSDDLGVGTAAAKYLDEHTRKDYVLVPVKVFGSKGETHSSAIYGALEWLAKRNDIDVVAIPWKPVVRSQAYIDGVELILASGKQVIIPEGLDIEGAKEVKKAKRKYKARGIRKAKLRLAEEGVAVMNSTAEYVNNWLEKNKGDL